VGGIEMQLEKRRESLEFIGILSACLQWRPSDKVSLIFISQQPYMICQGIHTWG